jgi:hypothetical protein
MSQAQILILVLYVGFATIILIAGFVYKEVRDHRRRQISPKLPFDSQPNQHNDIIHERVV